MHSPFGERFDSLGIEHAFATELEREEEWGARLDFGESSAIGEEYAGEATGLDAAVRQAEREADNESEAEWLETEWLGSESFDTPAAEETLEQAAARLGAAWSAKRGGKPTVEAMTKWLIDDYRTTVAGARAREANVGGTPRSAEAILRAWKVAREQQMQFQTDANPKVRALTGFTPPADVGVRAPHKLVAGSKEEPVAPIVARFAEDLKRRAPGIRLDTYGRHGLGAFRSRGLSVDVYVDGGQDARGFFRPDRAIAALEAVDASARAVGARWRAIYNDFTVADAINRKFGERRVIFVGQAFKDARGRPVGLNWHGPAPLVLHLHVDLVPLAAASSREAFEGFDSEDEFAAEDYAEQGFDEAWMPGEFEANEGFEGLDSEYEQPWGEYAQESAGAGELYFLAEASPLDNAGLTAAERNAVEITSTFETGRRGGFGGVTGNFDKQGLSLGLVNWNIGTGSLQPLLRAFIKEQPARWDAIFGADAAELRQLVMAKDPKAKSRLLQYVVERMNTSQVVGKVTKWSLVETWRARFVALTEDPAFRAIQIRFIRPMLDAAAAYCRRFGLTSELALCFMFDAVSSHGPWWLTGKKGGPALTQKLLERRMAERGLRIGSMAERDFLLLVADVFGEISRPEWAAKARRRKQWFVTGKHPRAAEFKGLQPRPDIPYLPGTGIGTPEAGESLAWLDTEGPGEGEMAGEEEGWHEMPGQEAEWMEMPEAEGFAEGFDEWAGEAFESGYAGLDGALELPILEAFLEAEVGRGSAAAGRAKAALALASGPVLRRGAMGPAVTALQRALTALGFDVAVDGAFGPNTERAVKAFQSRHNLSADGIVGPRTKTALAAGLRDAGGAGSGEGATSETRVFANFAKDSAVVPIGHIEPLRALARLLIDRKVESVEVTGHTSAEGADDYNERLGQERADAVTSLLVEEFGRYRASARPPAIVSSTRGERQLVGSTAPENRRVAVSFTTPAPTASMESVLRSLLSASMLLHSDPGAPFAAGALPSGAQKGRLWTYGLAISGDELRAGAVNATVSHGTHSMAMGVLERIRWHDVALALSGGATARLPLSADFLLGSFTSTKGAVAGTHAIWKLPATLDVGTCAVFAYDLRDPAAPVPITSAARFAARGTETQAPWALVACEIVCNRPRGDFETTGLFEFARIYPLIEVLSNDATVRIDGAVNLVRPLRSPMPHGWANGGEHLVGLYTDRNESLGQAAALLDLLAGKPNPLFPSWDVLFAYFDRNGASKSQVLTMVDPSKTSTRALTKTSARKEIDRLRGTLDPSDISKEPRQGAFDNIHLSPPMLAGPLATPAIGPIPAQTLIPATPVSMAPACVHDCFHVHWRWSKQFTAQPQLGWGPSGPHTLAGAPMVHPNQTVTLATTKGVPGFDYRVSAAAHPANDWMVVMPHGAAYAVSTAADPFAPLRSALATLKVPAAIATPLTAALGSGADAAWAWVYFFFQKWPKAPVLGAAPPPPFDVLEVDLPVLTAL